MEYSIEFNFNLSPKTATAKRERERDRNGDQYNEIIAISQIQFH